MVVSARTQGAKWLTSEDGIVLAWARLNARTAEASSPRRGGRDQLSANGAGGAGCCSFGSVQTWPQYRQRMDQTEASRDECRNAVTPSASQWGQS